MSCSQLAFMEIALSMTAAICRFIVRCSRCPLLKLSRGALNGLLSKYFSGSAGNALHQYLVPRPGLSTLPALHSRQERGWSSRVYGGDLQRRRSGHSRPDQRSQQGARKVSEGGGRAAGSPQEASHSGAHKCHKAQMTPHLCWRTFPDHCAVYCGNIFRIARWRHRLKMVGGHQGVGGLVACQA